jgi:hypothetical protein
LQAVQGVHPLYYVRMTVAEITPPSINAGRASIVYGFRPPGELGPGADHCEGQALDTFGTQRRKSREWTTGSI